jgi:hypothetical protein
VSYDLTFLLPAERPSISLAQFRAHFDSRSNYKVDGPQAMYGNEDTGCHFSFECSDPNEVADPEDEDPELAAPDDSLHPGGAVFHINYLRPFWFALEAEPEVQAFVQAFGFSVYDPQGSGMGRGEYSPTGFIDGWRAGNRFALSVMMGRQQPISTAPAEVVTGAWRWNRSVGDLQHRVGDDTFVPRVVWVIAGEGLARLASWWISVPTRLPDVELIAIGRPTPGLLSRLRGDGQDSVIRPVDEVAPFLTDWQADAGGGRWRSGRAGVDLSQLFRGPGMASADVSIVPAWEVFEAEEVAEIKPARIPQVDDLPPGSRIEQHGATKVIFVPNPPGDE